MDFHVSFFLNMLSKVNFYLPPLYFFGSFSGLDLLFSSSFIWIIEPDMIPKHKSMCLFNFAKLPPQSISLLHTGHYENLNYSLYYNTW